MEILKTKKEMKEWSEKKKKEARTICFVPTMGYLHQGHLSLMEKGKNLSDELVVSIFVNPSQFGPNEDLGSYPSDIENDLSLTEKSGATAVFLPKKEDMYPKNFQTEVILKNLSDHLCGKFKPFHFGGVATVATKLFNIVMPDTAVFGQKDFQQILIIRRLIEDLDLNVKIVSSPIVREKDGLAMSSRNLYLSKNQRASALSLSRSLTMGENAVAEGERNALIIKKRIKAFIETFPETDIEYISFCDPHTLEEVEKIETETLLALAVKIGKTRLIDNTLISPPQ